MENFKVKYNNKKGLTEAVFSGQLTINNIDKIVENVKTNLKKGNALKITSKDIENIDITFVQLLLSLVKTGKTEGFDVKIAVELPDEQKQLLSNAGFSELNIENKK